MERIRLITVNLLNDRADPDAFGDVLDRARPDVMVAQELGPEGAEVIEGRFPHHLLDPRLDHRGRGIASRFPAEFGEIPLIWRPGMWGRIDPGETGFVLANVHMRNAVTPPWWRSVTIRGRQVEDLFRWAEGFVGDDDVFVLAGDMNATPAWPVYRRVAERWQDLIAEAAARNGGEPEPTWGWRPGWPRVLRIDHIFGTGARVMNTSIVPVKGSDHAAVVVELELANGPSTEPVESEH